MATKRKQLIAYSLLFGSILLLSQSNLFISYSSTPGFLGFPNWLWWFMGFHILFILVLYHFVNNYEES